MERQSEPQSIAAAAVSGPSSAPSIASAAPSRPGNVFIRLCRLLLHRTLYLLARIFGPLRRYAGFLVVVAVLLGIIGWLSYRVWAPTAAAPIDSRVAMIAPSPAVENYIKGRQNFNAELMWASLSPNVQARRIQSGQSKDNLQAQANQERQQGVRYLNYDYVGGVNTDDGGKIYFYSAQFQLQNQKVKVPATFLVDADGKIELVYAIEPSQLMNGSTGSN